MTVEEVQKIVKSLLVASLAALVFAPAWLVYTNRIFPSYRSVATDTLSVTANNGTVRSPTIRVSTNPVKSPVPTGDYSLSTTWSDSRLNLLVNLMGAGIAILGFLGTVFLGVVGLQIYVGVKERERSENILVKIEKDAGIIQKAKDSAIETVRQFASENDKAKETIKKLETIGKSAELVLARLERFARRAVERDRDMMITGIKVRMQARRILESTMPGLSQKQSE